MIKKIISCITQSCYSALYRLFGPNCVVIDLSGQLGNQMFQYALGKRLQLVEGRKVRFYYGYFERDGKYSPQLFRFGIEVPFCSERIVLSFMEERGRKIDRWRRRYFGWHKSFITEVGATEYVLRKDIFSLQRGFVIGYWQSEEYFKQIREEILKEFTFPSPSELNLSLAKDMSLVSSVSIHVRRTDYISSGLNFYIPGIEDYYCPAMSFFVDRFKDVKFYVFSDDIEWCKNNLPNTINGLPVTLKFIDWNNGSDSIFDMWLMTRCQHNIIANSTFSWWGAWLNEKPDKIVIAPKRWQNFVATPHLCPEQWIRI